MNTMERSDKGKRWIQTYSGLRFDPVNPRPEDIRIEDVAHALAHQCRFTGHTKFFYSVAEHSIHVSRQCTPQDALAGLLHDASEAYLVDVASPLKRLPEFAGYREIEARLQAMIFARFGLAPELPASVKDADLRMLSTEAVQIMSPLHRDWVLPAQPYFDLRVDCHGPARARRLFLERFAHLGGRP